MIPPENCRERRVCQHTLERTGSPAIPRAAPHVRCFFLTYVCPGTEYRPQMKYFRDCILLCLTILLSSAAAFADKPWTEIRSPHFRVLTNGDLNDARHVAREFELMRYVFATAFSKFRLESGAPLTILVAADDQTAKELEPSAWKKSGGRLIQTARFGWDKQYVMIQMGLVQRANYSRNGQNVGSTLIRSAIYSSYAESILRLNFRWLPKWLWIGFSNFYGYTQFGSDKIYLGDPPPYFPTFIARLMPVESIVSDWNPVGDLERSIYPYANCGHQP